MKNSKAGVIETLSNSDLITAGHQLELLAIRHYDKSPVSNDKYLVVVYKEDEKDGFVITAYFTRKYNSEREIIWKP